MGFDRHQRHQPDAYRFHDATCSAPETVGTWTSLIRKRRNADIIRMALDDGLTHAQIARSLDISTSTVKRVLHALTPA